MAYDANGVWKQEDESVSARVTGLLSSDNPLLKQAETNAKQAANRRGLMNSSMAVQSGQSAVLGAALPIASQEAQQVHQNNMQATDTVSKEKIAASNVAAHDRQYAMAAIAKAQENYDAAFMNIAKEYNLPEAARNAYTQHLGRLRDSDLNLVEQMYGIDLQWGSTGAGGTTLADSTLVPGNPSANPLIQPAAL